MFVRYIKEEMILYDIFVLTFWLIFYFMWFLRYIQKEMILERKEKVNIDRHDGVQTGKFIQ